MLLIAGTFTSVLPAQSPAKTAQTTAAFEVASVRPNKSGAPAAMQITPGRLVMTSMPLRYIVRNAYRVFQESRLKGLPAWTDSESFDIEAKAPDGAGKEEMFAMLQSLLRERFKLALHRETEAIPAYTLVTAKGGPKLRALKDSASLPPRNPDMRRMGVLGDSAALAGFLSQMLGRPVIDGAAIQGHYYLMFDVPNEDVPKPSENRESYIQSTAGGYLFGAIEEQLGLKLTAGKSPVEVLIVDHIERPAAN